VPAADYGLALTVAAGHTDAAMKTALKLGVTEREIDALCDAITRVLAGADPLDPDQIREATGGASRSLGEAGKKKGVGTTLPLGLGRLQAEGVVRRLPAGGRLDQQRYRYTLWETNPLAGFSLSRDDAMTELARRYFESIGPATIDEFRAFAGLGVKAAQNAVAPLGLVPLEPGDARLMLAADREQLREFVPPAEPRYVLVGSVDGIVLLRRDPAALLEEADAASGAIQLGGLADLPSHVILDRGRIIGLWEYDTGTDSVAWHTFGSADAALQAAVARTEEFVRDQLGDARSFSLDSAKSRAPRVAALREAAARR
jgi:hypothetical protein